jgi:hypothetical protein
VGKPAKEGYSEVSEKIGQLKLQAPTGDFKTNLTDSLTIPISQSHFP